MSMADQPVFRRSHLWRDIFPYKVKNSTTLKKFLKQAVRSTAASQLMQTLEGDHTALHS